MDDILLPLEDLIRELSTEITQIHRWMAEAAGLNTTDLMALYFIRNGEGAATPKLLAENLGLTSGATAILLNRLEERGLVERTPHPKDRRAVLLSLGAQAALEPFADIRKRVREANANVFESLSPEEARIVRDFLARTLENSRKTLQNLRTAAAAGKESPKS
ncbi:MAG: MarR family transcriptional regulator [Devosia sp.]|jgi:DNA-binding MarR family transcriptional regulator|uniref:MarR family winged helix-turn-helix transcriptional regulator n=1 Tax=unclassified Devosia TaxID=196773 RepID=UPI001A0D359D|nr:MULTISPECIES: MarR family transcriptional regulator [unclassified Devosia]MBF0679514.1 MarR family transcriptional regulator [Devosia sp.]WEJ33921.1 MarR family transcriptional regulator [Devosia sp. SD17-2]